MEAEARAWRSDAAIQSQLQTKSTQCLESRFDLTPDLSFVSLRVLRVLPPTINGEEFLQLLAKCSQWLGSARFR
jgi:hypothetical protein